MIRILIAEDDPRSSQLLVRGLSESGFVVDAVGDGETAWGSIREGSHDLAALDVPPTNSAPPSTTPKAAL